MAKRIGSLFRKGWGVVWAWISKPRNWCEWAMVAVTIGILCYAGAQTGIATRQAKTLDRQTRILDKTIEMARSDQRAWVGAVQPVIVQLKDSSMRVSITIQNFGRTPALNLVPQIHVRTLTSSESFAPGRPAEPTDPKTRAALQPGQAFTLGPNEVPPISTDLADEINTGKTCFYAFGEVFYDDAFGEHHCTTFAYMLLPSLATWRVMNIYNTAD